MQVNKHTSIFSLLFSILALCVICGYRVVGNNKKHGKLYPNITSKSNDHVHTRLQRSIIPTWLMINTEINGHPARLLVDTGASYPCIIRKSSVSRLAIPIRARGAGSPAVLFGSNLTADFTEPQSVRISGADFGPKRWVVMDLDGILFNLDRHGEHCDGIFGAGFLDYYSAVINFDNNTLTLQPAKPALINQLDGQWVGVNLWNKGTEYGENQPSSHRLNFLGGELEMILPSFRIEYPFVFINNEHEPHWIDFVTINGARVMGIYQIKNDRLWIATAMLSGDDFARRPTTFENRPGSMFTTLILQRTKPAQ